MTWSPLCEVARTRDVAPSEQSPLGNGRPSPTVEHSTLMVFVRPVHDHAERDWKQTSPEDRHKRA